MGDKKVSDEEVKDAIEMMMETHYSDAMNCDQGWLEGVRSAKEDIVLVQEWFRDNTDIVIGIDFWTFT